MRFLRRNMAESAFAGVVPGPIVRGHVACRAGVVLIIVIGIASVVIVMTVGFLARMRSSAEGMNPVVEVTRCRLMLHSAIMYVQETSRIGWGVECFGWTDIRNGTLGPRGYRLIESDSPGEIPPPVWWNGGGYGDGFVEDNELPNDPDWPFPGSALRVDFNVWERPPYAVTMDVAPNPLRIIYDPVSQPIEYYEFFHQKDNDSDDTDDVLRLLNASILSDDFAIGLLDPQPIADNRGDFASGIVQKRPDSVGMGWFRIYREMLSDHDGRNSGDHVAISEAVQGGHVSKNWNVFVATVGSGASGGYRDWAEVVSEGATDRFGNEEMFKSLRNRERIEYWRFEWSGWSGGNFDPEMYDTGVVINGATGLDRARTAISRSFGGRIKWLQKLDGKPLGDKW